LSDFENGQEMNKRFVFLALPCLLLSSEPEITRGLNTLTNEKPAVISITPDNAGTCPNEAISNECQTAELFVSARHGNDVNDGVSATTALKNIQAAMARAVPGSTITLLPGWYDGGVVLKAGVSNRPITLRASRPGQVFLGKPRFFSSFEKDASCAYTWTTACTTEPPVLNEADTGRSLRHMASVEDVDELAGTYFFDATDKKIYVHSSDSAGVVHHIYSSVNPGFGAQMNDYTTVDGLTLAGFADAAILSLNKHDVTVANCTVYANGYGICFNSGSNCVVRGNHVWANNPSYNEGAQIFFSGFCWGNLIEDNIAHDTKLIGIRYYSGTVINCLTRRNILFNNFIGGFFYKVNHYQKDVDQVLAAHGLKKDDDFFLVGTGEKIKYPGLVAENNVAFNNPNACLGAPFMRYNTYNKWNGGSLMSVRGETDLVYGELNTDAKFADPAYLDFRLQSDSPARGRAPGGKDLGAFSYDGTVFYVKPDGNDAADGTSLEAAWKTLAQASKKLKAGQTLYVVPGEWREPLKLAGLKAVAGQPTRIRSYGKGKNFMAMVTVEECENLMIEHLRVSKAAGVGLSVRNSRGVSLKNCASYRNDGAGVALSGATATLVDSCAMVENRGAGLEATADCRDLELASNLLVANGGPQLQLAVCPEELFSEFNAFSTDGKGPMGKLGNDTAKDIEAWRTMAKTDAESFLADAKAIENLASGAFRIKSGHPLGIAGRYSKPVGPDGLAGRIRESQQVFERVEVLSTSRTTANLTWWTPARICGTLIQWGKSAGEYPYKLERGRHEGLSEYESFHSVSLVGLEPKTKYYGRVGFVKFWATPEEKEKGNDPVIWSEEFNFTTDDKDPLPRKLFVSTNGNDTCDGLTPKTAWQTLHKAAREAHLGDTVTLLSGRYTELLRPLQSGTADARITFRAEKPFTVFLDGGFIKGGREGRSHCIQVLNKAFLTFENLVCERVKQHDNGGYRDGYGYSGLIYISGSAGIEIKSCVMDGRYRWMPCLWTCDAGLMPGVPAEVPAFAVADSVLLAGWRAVGLGITRSAEMRNNTFARAMTGMISGLAGDGKLVLRNNIIQCLIAAKSGNKLFDKPAQIDSDYNCYDWDPENKHKFIAEGISGLQEWQKKTSKDLHSLEKEPGYPFSAIMGYGKKDGWREGDASVQLKIEDLILRMDSPCRKAGEKGEDIGPRWEKFLSGKN
jgi:parallel beta-helix repeat protein